MYAVAGTTQLCTLFLGLPNYKHFLGLQTSKQLLRLQNCVQWYWENPIKYTVTGTTQLHTSLLGLTTVYNVAGTTQIRTFWAGTTQLCRLLLGLPQICALPLDILISERLLGLPKYLHSSWDYQTMCIGVEATQLFTLLIFGRPNYVYCCWDYLAMNTCWAKTTVPTCWPIHSYAQRFWDYPTMYTVARTTQIYTQLMALPSYVPWCLDYVTTFNTSSTTSIDAKKCWVIILWLWRQEHFLYRWSRSPPESLSLPSVIEETSSLVTPTVMYYLDIMCSVLSSVNEMFRWRIT
jgi:hypothetical protein